MAKKITWIVGSLGALILITLVDGIGAPSTLFVLGFELTLLGLYLLIGPALPYAIAGFASAGSIQYDEEDNKEVELKTPKNEYEVRRMWKNMKYKLARLFVLLIGIAILSYSLLQIW